jgi:hypothetical protein
MLLSLLLLFLTVVSEAHELPVAIVWYLRGCITAAFFAVWQLLHAALHVPFPDSILYSSAAHTIYHAYKIGGVWRLNSTFTEASDMAGSLIGGLAILVWDYLHLPFKSGRLAAVLALVASILATLSTTGYLCLAMLAFVAALLATRRLCQQRSISRKKLVVSLIGATVCLLAFTFSPVLRSTSTKVMNSVFMDKQNSDSYKASKESDQHALLTLRETMYLGAGLGSERARGLIYTLLAGSGLPGVLLFAVAFAALLVASLRASPRASWRSLHGAPQSRSPGIVLGLTLIFAAMVVAGNEPFYPIFWLLFGVCLKQNSATNGRIAAPQPFTLLSDRQSFANCAHSS